VKGSRKCDPERLLSSRACASRLHVPRIRFRPEIDLNSSPGEAPVRSRSTARVVSATAGFLRTRFGTSPPGPRCARSTSATRNLKNLDPCSRLSPLRERRTPLEVCPPVGSRIPALHDARDRYDGIDVHSPGSSPGERWSIFVADTPSPRRLRTRPSQGRSRIRRSRRSLPRWPVKAWRLGRPRVPSLGSRPCFPSCDGEPPPTGERPTRTSHFPVWPDEEEVSVARSPLEQPVKACSSKLASSSSAHRPCGWFAFSPSWKEAERRSHDCESESLQHDTRRTGHPRRALRPLPRGTVVPVREPFGAVLDVVADTNTWRVTSSVHAPAKGSRPSILVGPSLSGTAATGSRRLLVTGTEGVGARLRAEPPIHDLTRERAAR